MKKVLVVYYSRSGNTRRVAEAIAEACDADLAEIRERRSRRGIAGWWRSVFEAVGHRRPPIEPIAANPHHYELVVVGSPVWASRMASPVRTWLAANGRALGRLGLFVTEGGSGGESAIARMAALCAAPPDACLVVKAPQLVTGGFRAAVADYVHRLRGAPHPSERPAPANPPRNRKLRSRCRPAAAH